MYPNEIDERDYKVNFKDILKYIKKHFKAFFASFVSVRGFLIFIVKNFHF